MKRIVAALAVTAAMVGFGIPVASADPAAVIHDSGLCGMPGSDANGNITFGGIGQAFLVLENNNKIMLKCKGTGITNLSGRAQSFEDFGCGIISPGGGFFLATDSHTTISASGVGTLTCTFDK